jgi:alanyl-tRNA synthetase
MTGNELRQSFVDFFIEKQHTNVPSASLLPDNPALPNFVNAGMNQFVPFFTGEETPPFSPGRAANSQKCIRAGGKQCDLEDVGIDTYHHTFFEMLGNWSFGDYFKREAIEWCWELLVERWKFPKERLYFTVYKPGDGEPGEADMEAHGIWSEMCEKNGLDPAKHVLFFGKADNFWMMGDTGPCGPCSEVHIDLTPEGDTGGKLVNGDHHTCIEIWNLVFIQNFARPDGDFDDLPAKHVDTGMGFERAAAAMQCTKQFTDFSTVVSNYDTDVFKPLFSAITELTGCTYKATLPGATEDKEQEAKDIAFRVIADHVRCLTAAIADDIFPDNVGRGYVLRRILRRAVRYGRSLSLEGPFLHTLVDVVADDLGEFFPTINDNRDKVKLYVKSEEESFGRTLDRGLKLFEDVYQRTTADDRSEISDQDTFKLYDTYGFPLDLTDLMARERGMTADIEGAKELIKNKPRGDDGGAVLEIGGDLSESRFIGFDSRTGNATVTDVVDSDKGKAVVLDVSPFYAEMGGQKGDIGELRVNGSTLGVTDTQKKGASILHMVSADSAISPGDTVEAVVSDDYRDAVERHHTVTHILHWALREVIGKDSSQKGSLVAPDYLRFDFNHTSGLTEEQLATIQRLVNERIIENAPVHWFERDRDEISQHKQINQFFGDKYGNMVRVVQIGGDDGGLNGYSMELCGGTHARATGDIGPFLLRSEGAISAGIRRVEAVAGFYALDDIVGQLNVLSNVCGRLTSPVAELEKRVENLLETQKRLEKELKSLSLKLAGAGTGSLVEQAQTIDGIAVLAADVSGFDSTPRDVLEMVLQKLPEGIVVLGSNKGDKCAFVCSVSPGLAAQGWHAGTIAREVASVAGGGGGGGAEKAQAGGRDPEKLGEALARATQMVEAGL